VVDIEKLHAAFPDDPTAENSISPLNAQGAALDKTDASTLGAIGLSGQAIAAMLVMEHAGLTSPHEPPPSSIPTKIDTTLLIELKDAVERIRREQEQIRNGQELILTELRALRESTGKG
jgi:hypothetical protein